MAGLTLEIGTTKVETFLEVFPRETGKAILRALKRGTASAATHANRVVSKDMGLKVGDVRKRIRVVNPTGATLAGELRASLKRVPLIEFGAKGPKPSRGRGRGVSYRTGGGRKRLPHAFIARMQTGHTGVFERRTTRRLPIRELSGPSVGRVVARNEEVIAARGEEEFLKELDRLLDRIIGGIGGSIAS